MAVEIQASKLHTQVLVLGDTTGELRESALATQVLFGAIPRTDISKLHTQVLVLGDTTGTLRESKIHSQVVLHDHPPTVRQSKVHSQIVLHDNPDILRLSKLHTQVLFGEVSHPDLLPVRRSAGILGCGTYQVFLQGRGGTPRIGSAPLKFSSLTYGFALDDSASGSIVLPNRRLSRVCIDVLRDIEPWQYEIAVWRDNTEVFVSPVIEPEWTDDAVTIQLRDLFSWFEHRGLPFTRTFEHIDLSEIFRRYVLDALARDPSPNILMDIGPANLKGSRSVIGGIGVRAADELRELARTGLDFTMRGRLLRVRRERIPRRPRVILIKEHMKPGTASYKKQGAGAATEWVVSGADNILATAGGPDSDEARLIGLLESRVSESSIRDYPTALAAATGRLRLTAPAPKVFSCVLSRTAQAGMDDLIPGIRADVRAEVGIADVNLAMRLLSVEVTVGDSDDDDLQEDVKVSLVPLGYADGPAGVSGNVDPPTPGAPPPPPSPAPAPATALVLQRADECDYVSEVVLDGGA